MRNRLFVAALAVLAAIGLIQPASAHHQPLNNPGYTGAEYIWGGADTGYSGGFLFYRYGRYYMGTAAHVVGPVGSIVNTPERHIGVVAYKGNYQIPSTDYALIDMGTTRPSARFRVNEGYTVPVTQRATGPEPAGTLLCSSGFTGSNNALNKCGNVDYAAQSVQTCQDGQCAVRAYTGYMVAMGGEAGSSGSAVYRPLGDGSIRAEGWIVRCGAGDFIPCRVGSYVPLWKFQRHCWTSGETLAGYPTGCDAAGYSSYLVTGSS